MTTTTRQTPDLCESPFVHPIVQTYRAWVDTLAGYMKRAADLLETLYAEQDRIIDQLRKLCAKTNSLRHSDFDLILGNVLVARRATRESLASLVDGFRAGREAVIQEIQATFGADVTQPQRPGPPLRSGWSESRTTGRARSSRP